MYNKTTSEDLTLVYVSRWARVPMWHRKLSLQESGTRILCCWNVTQLFMDYFSLCSVVMMILKQHVHLSRAQASELWVKGEKVTCGYISEDTRVKDVWEQMLRCTTRNWPLKNIFISFFSVCVCTSCYSGGVQIHICNGLHLHPDELWDVGLWYIWLVRPVWFVFSPVKAVYVF